jgi:hypothetical protein
MDIFEYAAENKLRFPYKGSISTEDLYDLGVEELDMIFKTLNREVKKSNEESLLAKKSDADTKLNVKIEIIKKIVSKKLAEIEESKNAIMKKHKNEKIMELIAQKQDENLRSLSIDELKKMLEE